MTDGSELERGGGAGRRLLVLFVVMTALGLLVKGVQGSRPANAIDFYHFWGIQAARGIDAELAGNPYTAPELTARILNRHADGLGDPVLRTVNQKRRVIDPTGTPLFYASFAPLPLDYGTSYTLFRWVQFLALVAGLTLVARAAGVSWLGGLALAGYGGVTLGPFTTDLQVGNANAIQLALLVGLAFAATRARREDRGRLGVVVTTGCVLATLFKPNVLPATGMLVLSRLTAVGARRFATEALVGLLVGALAIVASSQYFGDFGVWGDWYAYLYGDNESKLADYPIVKGNVAPPTVLSDWTGIGRTFTTLGLCLALVGSLLAALLAGAHAGGTSLVEYARRRVSEPWLALSIGVVVALVVPPLFWYHYFAWALVAPIWVVLAHGRSPTTTVLGMLTLAVMWGPPLTLVYWLMGQEQGLAVQSLAWVPLWGALLVLVARHSARTEATA